MARSASRGKEPSSAAKGASTGPTALPGNNKRKTPPPPPPLPEGASGATQPPPAKRNPALFQRTWPPGDEVRILEALATHRREHGGRLPTQAELFGALDGSLEKKCVGAKKLAIKQRSFKRRYDRDAKKAAPPADEHERRLYLLSRHVWGPVPAPRPPVPEVPRATQGKGAGAQASQDAAQRKSADHLSGKEAVKPNAKTLDQMRELYPYLVDEATILVEPAMLESLLLSLEESDAQVLEKKIRKARKKLAKAITESARINNMEMPTVVLLTSSKLQPEKLRVENEGHLDKTDDMDLCSKQRLAKMEHEVVELRQAVIASQSQAKGTRCESAKSGLQSIVAENQTPANILQKRIEAPNGLIDGTTVEVTSKRYCAVRHNVPPNNLKKQGVMLPPFNVLPAMPRKVFKKRPTPCRAARMKNMETSTLFLCQATKLQLEKSRVDKEDGLDFCAQERLARVEREIVELRQILIDSHYQAMTESNPPHDNSSLKGVRCRSEESYPQVAVAENQIPRNILWKKIEVPNGSPHENNEEVTSKCKHDGVFPRRIPTDYLKYEGLMIKPPFNTFHGRTRKIDTESQTVPNVVGQEVVLRSIVWPHTPVGKGILQSSSPSTIVGGMTIGNECCKVFLNEVLKRDAPLFRQKRDMKKMFDALKCSIAWPDSLIQRQG